MKRKELIFLAGAKNCKEMQKSAEESERKGVKKLRLEKKGKRVFGFSRRRVSEWELLAHTRQFSYEWQAKDL
jgi:hypothetical protein